MNELTPGKLARPMDRAAMNNDLAVLNQLLGVLNNPLITGAEPPKNAPKPTPAAPTIQMSAFKLSSNKIFFTGAAKAGKSWLSAKIAAVPFELDDPIRAMARDVFGSDAREGDLAEFTHEVFAWGEGQVSKKFPLTASRALFIGNARESQAKVFGISTSTFGTSAFWLNSLAARVNAFAKANPKEIVAVTDVGTAEQYKFLRAAGFMPIHVMCHNLTRNGRGGTNVIDPLVSSIERDITNKISQSPGGQKLWVVWSDTSYPPPSKRFLTVDEFTGGAKP